MEFERICQEKWDKLHKSRCAKLVHLCLCDLAGSTTRFSSFTEDYGFPQWGILKKISDSISINEVKKCLGELLGYHCTATSATLGKLPTFQSSKWDLLRESLILCLTHSLFSTIQLSVNVTRPFHNFLRSLSENGIYEVSTIWCN